MGKGIKFKPASFYLEVASKLAEEVEGLTRDETSDEEPEVLFSAGGSLDDTPVKRTKSTGLKNKKQGDKASPDAPPPPPGTVGGGID